MCLFFNVQNSNMYFTSKEKQEKITPTQSLLRRLKKYVIKLNKKIASKPFSSLCMRRAGEQVERKLSIVKIKNELLKHEYREKGGKWGFRDDSGIDDLKNVLIA